MQNLINVLKKIIPKYLLFKYEDKFRFVYYQFYKGNAFECNVCSKKLRKFTANKNGEKICPNCGSLARTRRLWNLLANEFLAADLTNKSVLFENKSLSVLDFSPPRQIYKILKKNEKIYYTGSNFNSKDNFLADEKYDITNINCEDEKYDLIICFHVLEHIENDRKAMKELHRILKNKGICLVQTPLKEGEIFENNSIKTEAERLKYYGQSDHFRIYSLAGLKSRLEECDFDVTIMNFCELENNKFAYNSEENILVCRKKFSKL